MKKSILILNIFLVALVTSCKEAKETDKVIVPDETTTEEVAAPERVEPKVVSYRMVKTSDWLQKIQKDSLQLRVAYALNRTDAANVWVGYEKKIIFLTSFKLATSNGNGK